jgi:hypothetical protein
MNPETKEKLKRFAPWLLGGAALVVVLLMMRRGSSQQGRAPVQDLSRLGGGQGAPVMLQPEVVPGQVAEQIGERFRGGRLAAFRMKGFWDQQQLGSQISGPAISTPPTIRQEAPAKKIRMPGQDLPGTPGRGIGEQIGGWVRENLLGGAPVTLGNLAGFGAQVYGARQLEKAAQPKQKTSSWRGTSPAGNGAQRTNEPTWLEV